MTEDIRAVHDLAEGIPFGDGEFDRNKTATLELVALLQDAWAPCGDASFTRYWLGAAYRIR